MTTVTEDRPGRLRRRHGVRAAVAVLLTAVLALPAAAATAAPVPASSAAAPAAVASSRPDAMGAVTWVGWGWADGRPTLTADWADVARATAYDVYIATTLDGVLTLDAPTVTVTSSKATVTALDPDTRYYIRVYPVNSAGRGSGSARVSQLTPPTERAASTSWQSSKPDAAGTVRAIDGTWTASGSTLTVDWADVKRATFYQLFASTSFDGIVDMTVPTMVVTGSRATLTGLKPGTEYTVRVYPVNNVGRGSVTPRVRYTTLAEEFAGQAWQTARPAAAGTVRFTGAGWGDTGATLTAVWSAVSRATRYEVYVGTSFDSMMKRVDARKPAATVTRGKVLLTGLEPRTRYYVKIYPANNIGRGTSSTTVSQITATKLTADRPWQKERPAKVGLVHFTGKSLEDSGATLDIDWASVARATSYDVFVSTSYSGALKATTPRMTVLSSRATITKLKAGTSYYVRVAANNNVGRGSTSARVAHTTITAEAKATSAAPYSMMTWNVCSNVCGGIGTRTTLINTRIKELRPDIVALQEASRYTRAPVGYAFVSKGQNAILVRKGVFAKVGKQGKVDASGSAKFRSTYASAGHGTTWVTLKHKSGRFVVVFNTHLKVGTTRTLIKQRQYEAERLMPYVSSTLRKLGAANPRLKGAAAVILGDMNTSLSTSGDKTLATMKKAGWVDAFMQARTLTKQHHNSANPDRKTKPVVGTLWGAHIDKVMVKPGRTIITSWENAGKMKGSRYVTPLPSDHHPILVKGVFT